MAMNFLGTAADLVPLGFKVFPLATGRKVPLIKAWQREASDDLDTITAWAAEWPKANIGVATGAASGVIVIDVDTKNGKDGHATLAVLAKQGKELPPSPIAITPSGGRHLYIRAVPGIRNVVEIQGGRGIGAGIDIRADGGYIVAPPSILQTCEAHGAGTYRWLVPPMTANFPRLPDWAAKMLMPKPPRPVPPFAPDVTSGDVEPLARFVASSTEGQRNNRLHWAACRAGEMAARGRVSAQSAGRRLVAAAAAAGYTGGEVVRTIDSGFHESGLSFRP